MRVAYPALLERKRQLIKPGKKAKAISIAVMIIFLGSLAYVFEGGTYFETMFIVAGLSFLALFIMIIYMLS